jgi:hypothetical protein
MRKNIFVLLLFMAYPARAQVSSGTIIVFNLSKNQVVVAADSVAVDHDTGIPNYSYCKIAAFGHQFIFASAGNVHNIYQPPFGRIESWDNTELAGDAVRSTSGGENGDASINAIATFWANDVASRWKSFYGWDRRRVSQLAEAYEGQLTAGVFIQAKGLLLEGVVVELNGLDFLNPIKSRIAPTLGRCWPCGQEQGEQICAGGSHVDFVAQFCSERKKNTKICIRTPLTKANTYTKLAVKIAELTIDTYEKTTGDVGGKVDAVTLTNDGTITWNSRKDKCPENQD